MRFLILNGPNDIYGYIVKRALEKTGNNVIINHRQQTINGNYDVIWRTDAWKPSLEDDQYLVRENSSFYDVHNLSCHTWWINSNAAMDRINFKLLQLKIASDCGLTIPTTLCSGDQYEINQFYLKYNKHGVTYLPQSLPLATGLFQQNVNKKYSIQVTCFGDYLVAAKRISPVNFEPYVLPIDLAFKIRACMRGFGIVFGSFYFSVTPVHEYVFMDVDNQGQFLWIEVCNPAFKMLDMFVNFIMHKSVDFIWNPKGLHHFMASYQQ